MVILLDTNYLIRALVVGTAEAERVDTMIAAAAIVANASLATENGEDFRPFVAEGLRVV